MGSVTGIINNTQDLSTDCNPAVRHLQHFISELEEFLKQHVKEIQNLKGFLERGAGYPPAMCTSVAPDHAPRRENGIQDHVNCIQHFLEQHTHNIESLRVTLRSPMPELRLPIGSEETKECKPNDPQIAAVQMFEREDHSSSYSTIVLMVRVAHAPHFDDMQLTFVVHFVPSSNSRHSQLVSSSRSCSSCTTCCPQSTQKVRRRQSIHSITIWALGSVLLASS